LGSRAKACPSPARFRPAKVETCCRHIGPFGQAGELEHLLRFVRDLGLPRIPQVRGNEDILQDAQAGEWFDDLEGSAYTLGSQFVRGVAGDVLAQEVNTSAGRLVVSADRVEEGRLARRRWGR